MKRLPLLLFLAIGLSACGFHLRGSGGGELPTAMKKVRITGLPDGDPLREQLTTVLTRYGATVVPGTDDQAVVLQVTTEDTQRNLSLNRTGLATEQDLGYKVNYDVKTAKGEVIEALKKLKFNREQYNDQFLVLGRAEETATMRQEMTEEAAETLARRLIYLLKDKSAGSGVAQPQAGPAKAESQERDEDKTAASAAEQPPAAPPGENPVDGANPKPSE